MLRRHLLAYLVLLCPVVFAPGGARGAAELPVRFHRLMLEDGLSQSSIISIHQDSRGFIWMGTQDGLNRYDGSKFVAYKTDPDRKHSLSDPNITCIAEDAEGDLWLGTEGGGFNRYLRNWELFYAYRQDPGDPDKHHYFDVRDVVVAPDGIVWLATLSDGLLRFDPETEQFSSFANIPGDPTTLPSNDLNTLLAAPHGGLWVGTNRGLVRFDTATGNVSAPPGGRAGQKTVPRENIRSLNWGAGGRLWLGLDSGLGLYDPQRGTFEYVELRPDGGQALTDYTVTATLEMPDGTLWVGTEHRGLFLLDPPTGRCRGFANDPHDPASLSDNEVTALMLDRTGVIWIGTSNGANRLDSKAKQFYHVSSQAGRGSSLSHDCVWSLWENRDGDVWAVTEEGLNIYHGDTGKVDQVPADPANPRAPSYNSFIELYEDQAGGMWLAARDGALNRYDPATGIYRRFVAYPDSAGMLATDEVFAVTGDADGNIWLGSMDGVEVYDPQTDTFTSLRHDPSNPFSLPQGSIRAIMFDRWGRLWVSAWGNGVSCRDPRTGAFRHFRHRPDDGTSLSGNVALCLYADSKGRMWIGTSSGLNLLDPDTGKCRRYTEKDGLPNNTIYGIQEDKAGKLWFSTNYGLAQFSPDTGQIQNYTAREGIQDNEFNMGADHQGKSGLMYFGGIKGFSAFYPDSIRHNPYPPEVVLTDFRIFNRPVDIGADKDGHVILDKAIAEVDHIDLSHRDNVISFEFSVLHFASPEKNRYSYRLEGFEEQWNDVGTRNHATYTNLPPGHYSFHVKGANNDGVWNNTGTSVDIFVHPPFYRKAWFLALGITLIGSGIYGMHRYRMRLLGVKNRVLERRVTERTEDLTRANNHLQQEIGVRRSIEDQLREAKDTAEAATRAKSEFLANMSHEIRTPMNGVLGMTAIMLDTELSPDQREYSEMIHSSAKSLLVVINDILDFSKIEAGKLELENIEFDLCQALDEVTDVLALKAREKSLHFSCVIDPGVPRLLHGDPGRLRQILTNLANNAVKFTSRGTVRISVSVVQQSATRSELRFEVRDSGLGIPADRIDRIFQSFTQVDASITRQYGGTGLGLAIVKQLVALMGGQIGVDSVEGEGATFWFTVEFPTEQKSAVTRDRIPVLVAHDDPATRHVLCRQLEFLGYPSLPLDPGALVATGGAGLPAKMTAALIGCSGDRNQVAQLVDHARRLLAGRAGALILLSDLGTPVEPESLATLRLDGYMTVPTQHTRLEAALLKAERTDTPVAGPADTANAAAAETATAQKPLLLLAEDNPINQRVATLMLQKLGYQVEVANNGLEVLAAVAARTFAAILMDVQMPLMDGLEAARRIRAADSPALDPQVPIIALTAHAMDQDRRRSMAAGMNDHVSKPMESARIAEILAEQIRLAAPRREPVIPTVSA